MHRYLITIATATCLATPSLAATVTGILVPGDSNPYLSGQPNGTAASNGDVAPNQSPVEVLGLGFSGGDAITFPSVTGTVSHGVQTTGPEGGSVFSHAPGAQNGFSNVTSPINALLGVFLGDTAPDPSAAPTALSFATALSRDFSSLAPEIAQIFFIGDGRDDDGDIQSFIAPNGATRLFLGTMDGFGWFNNTGAFVLDVEAGTETLPGVVPLPAGGVLILSAVAALGLTRRRR